MTNQPKVNIPIAAQIFYDVTEALDNATHANGHSHEYHLTPEAQAAQIHDWSGIENYDPDNPNHAKAAADGVKAWRSKNPETTHSPCPCGDNDGLPCSLPNCPYTTTEARA